MTFVSFIFMLHSKQRTDRQTYVPSSTNRQTVPFSCKLSPNSFCAVFLFSQNWLCQIAIQRAIYSMQLCASVQYLFITLCFYHIHVEAVFFTHHPAKFFQGFLFFFASVRDVLFYFLKFLKNLKKNKIEYADLRSKCSRIYSDTKLTAKQYHLEVINF